MTTKKPQLENGYLRIACGKPENDILLALARTGLNGTQYSICLVVIRKTWGYQKNWDWISYTDFEKLTNQYRANISRELKRLIVAKILLVDKSNPRKPRYKFNKNFNEWNSSGKATSSQKATDIVAKKLPKIVAKKLPTKDNINNNIKDKTKEFVDHFSLKVDKDTNFRVTSKRVKKVKTRLKEYTMEDLKLAVDNFVQWDWYKENKHAPWVTPDYLIRNDEQIEKFLNFNPKKSGDDRIKELLEK